MKNILIISSSIVFFAACGVTSSSSLFEEWNAANDPTEIAGMELKRNFADLPTEGRLEVLPWSDDYWPTYKGGLSYRWQSEDFGYELLSADAASAVDTSGLSPAEKYDLFVGREDFPLTRAERSRTKILRTVAGSNSFDPDYKIPRWEGLCHGWAPASVNFEQPKAVAAVGAGGRTINFSSSDVKALLTYYQQYAGNRSTRTEFMSERCRESFADLKTELDEGKITAEEYKARRESSACSDVNAGAFHLVLANEIGLKKKPFIVDVTRDAEVWNQAVQQYTSSSSPLDGVSEGAAPGTVKEIKVSTIMDYAVEVEPHHESIANSRKQGNYDYVLELNAADEIIGGRWISEDRPDFLWRESTPRFRGYFKALETIYQQSIAD